MATINLGRVKGDKGDRGETGLINGATQVQVHPTTKVMYNGTSIPANTAASHLIGGGGQQGTVPINTDRGINEAGIGGRCGILADFNDRGIQSHELYSGFYFTPNGYLSSEPDTSPHRLPIRTHSYVMQMLLAGSSVENTRSMQVQFPANPTSAANLGDVFYKASWDGESSPWYKFYTTGNTTIESGTNYLKVASPILRLQHNDFAKEHEAEKMNIAVENPSVGVYKVTGTTGLRNDGTWYFSPPKDEHNNVLCMVEVSEQDSVITINTYKKKFDFETVSIVPDYEQPTDIPEGAIVMLRFNDLPQDELDEPTA